MVVPEAFALGAPVAVSGIGLLADIVRHGDSGVVFKPGNPESLFSEVRNAWETLGLLERLGANARKEFETKYTAGANYQMLMDIYAVAIHRRLHKTN